MYSFEQLKIFVAVCECGSFSAAARQLKRAQSGVSQSVSNLEIALNQSLFDRSRNIPVLTAQGTALLPIAKSILHQQLHFDQKVASLDQQHEHELVLAVEESLVDAKLLEKLSELADQFPITNIEIVSASTFDVEKMVSEGTAQVGIIYADGKMQNEMDFFTLGYNRFITVVSPSHPLSSLKSVKDTDLRNYRQIVQRSSQGKELWFSYGISIKAWYASNHLMLLHLAQQGIGWAVIPESLAASAIREGKLVSLNLEYEPNGWINTIDCITSRRHQSGPVLQAVCSMFKTYMKSEIFT
ncbi:LysR family transcriptional regulator [Photobacterium profundum]|uniref:Hypothetical transcriptional regulator n=1 Tax=Photobacterium profundum (strain SS9) TaxID=298386 RepID=Q6LHD3_PHOPR|nr:LysR family transcriptional regulator [Photobacterium profundum]CAG23297.1 hypothetical transcriptional regulator [Photobacterium profundum SS9]